MRGITIEQVLRQKVHKNELENDRNSRTVAYSEVWWFHIIHESNFSNELLKYRQNVTFSSEITIIHKRNHSIRAMPFHYSGNWMDSRMEWVNAGITIAVNILHTFPSYTVHHMGCSHAHRYWSLVTNSTKLYINKWNKSISLFKFMVSLAMSNQLPSIFSLQIAHQTPKTQDPSLTFTKWSIHQQ